MVDAYIQWSMHTIRGSTYTSLVKEPEALARLGIGNGTEVDDAVKGVERCLDRNFSRFDYG